MALVVRVETRRDGEGKDLAGVRVLHDDGAVQRLHLFDLRIKRALGNVLDVGVDREDEIFAGQRLRLFAAQAVPLGIKRGDHVARCAVQFVVEAKFEAAEAIVIGADVAEDLCRKITVGVEALELLLKIDALQVEFADAVGGLRIELAGDPGEAMRGVEAGQHLLLGSEVVSGVGVDNLCEEESGLFLVVAEFGRNGEDAVD